MSAYNGLNSVKTNLEKAGICQIDGLRLSDPKCTHATPAQIAATIRMDADADFMQAHKDQARLCNAIILDVQPRLELVLDLCGDIDAQNGELASRTDNGVDTVDAVAWRDAPEYKEAVKVADNFDYNSVPEVKF
jgi:hypothetical protein